MPDISMCKGGDCPLKEKCYRYKATPTDEWQTYLAEIPYNKETKECNLYWKIKTTE